MLLCSWSACLLHRYGWSVVQPAAALYLPTSEGSSMFLKHLAWTGPVFVVLSLDGAGKDVASVPRGCAPVGGLTVSCATHNPCDVNLLQMALSCDEVISHVPVLGSWMLPGGLVLVCLLIARVCYG